MKKLVCILCLFLIGCPQPGSGRIAKIEFHDSGGFSYYTIDILDSKGALFIYHTYNIPNVHVGETVRWTDSSMPIYGHNRQISCLIKTLEEEKPHVEKE